MTIVALQRWEVCPIRIRSFRILAGDQLWKDCLDCLRLVYFMRSVQISMNLANLQKLSRRNETRRKAIERRTWPTVERISFICHLVAYATNSSSCPLCDQPTYWLCDWSQWFVIVCHISIFKRICPMILHSCAGKSAITVGTYAWAPIQMFDTHVAARLADGQLMHDISRRVNLVYHLLLYSFTQWRFLLSS